MPARPFASSEVGAGMWPRRLYRLWALGVFLIPLWLAMLPNSEGVPESDGHSAVDDPSLYAIPLVEAAQVSLAADCGLLAAGKTTIAVWNQPGPKRVGLQAGHWLTREVPDELGRLRTQTGTSSGGYTEWELNLDIAGRVAELLTGFGVEAEVLPTTVPPCYQAHVFLSIHADGDLSGVLHGFKVARASGSAIPTVDDALVAALNERYMEATGLFRDDQHISRRMLNYYAFNGRRYRHTIAPGVPAAIIETGFLTHGRDRVFLTQQTDRVAAGIANGILQFLGLPERAPLP